MSKNRGAVNAGVILCKPTMGLPLAVQHATPEALERLHFQHKRAFRKKRGRRSLLSFYSGLYPSPCVPLGTVWRCRDRKFRHSVEPTIEGGNLVRLHLRTPGLLRDAGVMHGREFVLLYEPA